MFAILRRELLGFFSSPIAYIYLAVFYIFAGYFFFTGPLYWGFTQLGPVFSNLFSVVLFLIPILTMRLMSEDKKHRTDQALLTAPVSLTGIVLGKFFAAMVVYLLGLAITVVFAFVVAVLAAVNWLSVFSNLVALLLLGMAHMAICLFVSSLTENQVIAAIGGFASAFLLLMLGSLKTIVTGDILQKIITGISFSDRYSSFSVGMFNLADVVFFLSVCAIFLFLTVRVLEKRRWS